MSAEPYYADDLVTIHHGDCLDVLATLPDASVDAVVTDPPYGLEFMGKEWDSFKQAPTGGAAFTTDGMGKGFKALPTRGSPNPTCRNCKGMKRGQDRPGFTRCRCEDPDFPNVGLKQMRAFGEWCELWTAECLRVLKPGGHLLAFGGTRTWHRLACAVEDAGFEVRDSIAWLYGSGFPKSLDVSKAIDKRRDWSLVERLSGEIRRARAEAGLSLAEIGQATLTATNDAYGKWYHRGGHMFFETGRSLPSRPEWDQLRHVLPIASEFAEVYDEAEREVTGHHEQGNPIGLYEFKHGEGNGRTADARRDAPATDDARAWQGWGTALKPAFEPIVVARKPLVGTVAANVLAHGTGALNVDGCRVDSPGPSGFRTGTYEHRNTLRSGVETHAEGEAYRKEGHAAGRWPANVVLDESQAAELDAQSGTLHTQDPRTRQGSSEVVGVTPFTAGNAPCYDDDPTSGASRFFYVAKADTNERVRINGTAHPTVKPLALMRWLVRLVTPRGGTVLEPFAGSGTTVEACILEGFRCIAIEREPDYLPLIVQRINRRRDPLAAIKATGDDGGLFDLLGEETA